MRCLYLGIKTGWIVIRGKEGNGDRWPTICYLDLPAAEKVEHRAQWPITMNAGQALNQRCSGGNDGETKRSSL